MRIPMLFAALVAGLAAHAGGAGVLGQERRSPPRKLDAVTVYRGQAAGHPHRRCAGSGRAQRDRRQRTAAERAGRQPLRRIGGEGRSSLGAVSRSPG